MSDKEIKPGIFKCEKTGKLYKIIQVIVRPGDGRRFTPTLDLVERGWPQYPERYYLTAADLARAEMSPATTAQRPVDRAESTAAAGDRAAGIKVDVEVGAAPLEPDAAPPAPEPQEVLEPLARGQKPEAPTLAIKGTPFKEAELGMRTIKELKALCQERLNQKLPTRFEKDKEAAVHWMMSAETEMLARG